MKLGWLVMALALAGCRSHERVVAWRDLPPQLAPEPRATFPHVPDGAPTCADVHARVTATGKQGVNSATTLYYFTVRNAARRTCALPSAPAVTVLRGPNVRVHQLPAFGLAGATTPSVFGLRAGAHAGASIFVSKSCERPSSTARIAVDARGAERAAVSLPACPGLDLGVTPWELPEPPEVANPMPVPLRAEIAGRPHARRGATLVYRVRVTNVSKRPFRYGETCPTVHEWIGAQNGPIFGLNCRATGPIAAGTSVVFEMRYDLSPHYRPGVRTLHWKAAVEPGGVPIGTKAPLTIDP